MRPVVVEGVSTKSRVATEEVFGPFVTIHPFDTEDEAVDIANDSQYGLACNVWTKDIGVGQRVAQNIDTGG
jgi:acyl-CoA reductase-like NAD-dependent aldehyde dehydrogenase